MPESGQCGACARVCVCVCHSLRLENHTSPLLHADMFSTAKRSPWELGMLEGKKGAPLRPCSARAARKGVPSRTPSLPSSPTPPKFILLREKTQRLGSTPNMPPSPISRLHTAHFVPRASKALKADLHQWPGRTLLPGKRNCKLFAAPLRGPHGHLQVALL